LVKQDVPPSQPPPSQPPLSKPPPLKSSHSLTREEVRRRIAIAEENKYNGRREPLISYEYRGMPPDANESPRIDPPNGSFSTYNLRPEDLTNEEELQKSHAHYIDAKAFRDQIRIKTKPDQPEPKGKPRPPMREKRNFIKSPVDTKLRPFHPLWANELDATWDDLLNMNPKGYHKYAEDQSEFKDKLRTSMRSIDYPGMLFEDSLEQLFCNIMLTHFSWGHDLWHTI